MYYGKGIRRQKAGAGKDPPDAESLQQTAFPDKGRHFIFPAGSAVWGALRFGGGDRSASCRKGKTHCGKLSDPVRDRYGFTPFLYFV